MALRKFVAALLAVALLAGLPKLAPAASADPDCATVISASTDGGCCGGADQLSCSSVCSVSPEAAIGKAADPFQHPSGVLPPGSFVVHARSVALPPDTAPPKSLCA